VLRNVVRIDEDVVQIYHDYDIDHIHKDVIHKSLKSGSALVSPSGITKPLKGTIVGLECSSSISSPGENHITQMIQHALMIHLVRWNLVK